MPAKRSALRPPKPGRVHLDHAGRAQRLQVAVHEPDQREGGEGAGERGETENEIHHDGADRADQHGGLAADAIGQEAVHELAGAVGERPRAQHSA